MDANGPGAKRSMASVPQTYSRDSLCKALKTHPDALTSCVAVLPLAKVTQHPKFRGWRSSRLPGA